MEHCCCLRVPYSIVSSGAVSIARGCLIDGPIHALQATIGGGWGKADRPDPPTRPLIYKYHEPSRPTRQFSRPGCRSFGRETASVVAFQGGEFSSLPEAAVSDHQLQFLPLYLRSDLSLITLSISGPHWDGINIMQIFGINADYSA